MGKPKFSRKKYETPSHPWQEDRIKAENEMIKKYGLKNKREIWKAQTKLKKYRQQARELLAKVGTDDIQSKKESDQLLMHLNRMNILPLKSNLDDVLALDTESILSRRLQTLTYLKGLSTTPDHARQLISHGHIAIDSKRVTVPSYMVTKDEESKISYNNDSPLNDMVHPARPRSDYKSPLPVKKEKEEPKKQDKKEEKPETPKEEVKEEVAEEPKKEEKTEGLEESEKQEEQKEKTSEETNNKEENKEEIKTEQVTAEEKKQEEKQGGN